MFRINEELVKAGKLNEGHVRITQRGWEMTSEEIKELAGFDVEEKIGTTSWEIAVLTDERRNKVVSTINYAEIYMTESYEEYEKYICKHIVDFANSYINA